VRALLIYSAPRLDHVIGCRDYIQTGMSNFRLEFEEGVDALGVAGTIYFKFLSVFSVKIRPGEDPTVRFGPLFAETTLKNAEDLKAYLKEQKEWVRETRGRFPTEMRIRMWWVVQKCIDLNFFDSSELKFLILWMDGCAEQIRDVVFTNPSEYPPFCTPPRGPLPISR
jgi:hypothetical protein